MLRMLDVNVLVNAYNTAAPDHPAYVALVDGLRQGPELYSVSSTAFTGFLRIVTHPNLLEQPASPEEGLDFCEALRDSPAFIDLGPGPRHWDLFRKTCLESDARGNLVFDIWLAALAVEHGAEWLSADRDFKRFPGLRWRHPLHD